eukprot:TRINITY_DN2548_c0_g1_i1.p1 TRINITY_DN2548_c0_g1~~TRINITY_DN2548_c0_g1_i1.p1  ORF type:complete len:171 (+),score=27.04 TRINITY_DN2548_c0_g1_i1:76-588(+)
MASVQHQSDSNNNNKISQNANSSVSSHQIVKRLQSELMTLMMSPPQGCTAFPNNGDFFNWNATITGVDGTPYEGQTYKLTLEFGSDYPFTAPCVKFETSIYHPNVDTSGNICLDILKEKWSAVYNVSTILLSIQSLLGEPNNDSPLNVDAATTWDDQVEYCKKVTQVYQG